MKRNLGSILLMICMLFSFTGCGQIGDKTANMGIIYGVTTFFSLLLIIVYCGQIRKKDAWFLLLFSSVFIVNLGYLSLALSGTLEEALLANRIAYLGSVFLPLSMLFIILNVCKLNYSRWFVGFLLCISTIVFIIAASPGYSEIYYKSVTLSTVNGITVLNKVYGPWHSIYLYYLIAYFSAMIGFIFYAIVKKKISNSLHAVILLSATFVNIAVWFAEQLVHIDFEFFSVSYIITEIFLLLLTLLMQETSFTQPVPVVVKPEVPVESDDSVILEAPDQEMLEKGQYLVAQLPTLTPTEKMIYDYYLEGRAAKEILVLLDIKENTLKYHNKNIYSKLGVSSRKQMIELACFMKKLNF